MWFRHGLLVGCLGWGEDVVGQFRFQWDEVVKRESRRIGRSSCGRIVPAEFDAPMAAGCLTAPENLTFMMP